MPSLGMFLAHLCVHFHERCIVYQGTTIYGVSVSNVLEHVTICLTTYIAHVSCFEYPGRFLLISATLLLEYIICRYDYCFSFSSVLIYSNQDLIRFSKSSPRMFPQTQSLSRSYKSTSIWSAFIPPASLASFHQGAYFSTEIIPDAVAAISLNTLYFYKRNHGTSQYHLPGLYIDVHHQL